MLDKNGFIRYNVGKRQWRKLLLGLFERTGPYLPAGTISPPLFISVDVSEGGMREASIFCDESGTFSKYNARAPYYITTFVLHDQSESIAEMVEKLDTALASFQIRTRTVHAGPLIRREDEYEFTDIITRRKIFQRLFVFTRTCKIAYQSFIVDKRHITDEKTLSDLLSNQIRAFLLSNLAFFQGYDRIVLYYDYGQAELTKILKDTCGEILSNIEIRRVRPVDYRLFQAADLLCTLELLAQKAENKTLSRSELAFFHSERELRRTYLKPIQQKRF